MSTEAPLSTNTLAFIALANEYCNAMESARESEPRAFVAAMLRLLPRIYIVATDLAATGVATLEEEAYLDSTLDEDYYDAVRLAVERLLGPDDTYLEVFEQDMKYSDTPIGASIAESLADIFQVMFNFVAAVKDAPQYLVQSAVAAVIDEFGTYWGQTLTNVLRPLHHVAYNNDWEE